MQCQIPDGEGSCLWSRLKRAAEDCPRMFGQSLFSSFITNVPNTSKLGLGCILVYFSSPSPLTKCLCTMGRLSRKLSIRQARFYRNPINRVSMALSRQRRLPQPLQSCHTLQFSKNHRQKAIVWKGKMVKSQIKALRKRQQSNSALHDLAPLDPAPLDLGLGLLEDAPLFRA